MKLNENQILKINKFKNTLNKNELLNNLKD